MKIITWGRVLCASLVLGVSTAMLEAQVRAGGVYGGRWVGRARLAKKKPEFAAAIEKGLAWLAAHQDEDGSWDAASFMRHDPKGKPTDGPGKDISKAGITALVMLAFMGDGNCPSVGNHATVVEKAADWLCKQQGADGQLPRLGGSRYIIDHAIGTLALCEVSTLAGDVEDYREAAQAAVDHLCRLQHPKMAWHAKSETEPSEMGASAWAIMALTTASRLVLALDAESLPRAEKWLESVTKEDGTVAAPTKGVSEASDTAAGLLARFQFGQNPRQQEVMVAAGRELKAEASRTRKDKTEDKPVADPSLWFHGACAAYQMGGSCWDNWSRTIMQKVISAQRQDGSFGGSWDPAGPIGKSVGRLYSTALMVLTVESYYRYTRMVR